MPIRKPRVMPSSRSTESRHPVVFLVLYLPFGIFSGYLTVTLAYLFSKAGISVEQIAGLAAMNMLPQTLKFLWAPMVDSSLTLKKWYLLSTLIVSACLLATGIVPIKVSNLTFLTVMIFVSSFARSLVSAATGGLAAHDTAADSKGRAAGYMMSGNLGGAAIGGGLGLWLTQHTNLPWAASAVLAAICLLSCVALYSLKEPVSTIKAETIRKTALNLFKDIWRGIKTKLGLLALILCILPIGCAGAGYLFAAMAKDWKASADMVAIVTGLIGGLVTILGCLVGGWACDLMNRQRAYLLFGLLQAIVAMAMAFCPHIPLMYIIWTLAYTFITGLAYAAFSAFALEATGKGAAASKYELYNAVSWVPIYLMVLIEGLSYTKWGANGVLNIEGLLGCLSVALFLGLRVLVSRTKAIPEAQEPVLSV